MLKIATTLLRNKVYLYLSHNVVCHYKKLKIYLKLVVNNNSVNIKNTFKGLSLVPSDNIRMLKCF